MHKAAKRSAGAQFAAVGRLAPAREAEHGQQAPI